MFPTQAQKLHFTLRGSTANSFNISDVQEQEEPEYANDDENGSFEEDFEPDEMSDLFSLDRFENEADYAEEDCNEHDGGNKLPAKQKHEHSLSSATNICKVDSQSSFQPPPNIAKPSPNPNLHLAARLSLLLQEQQSRNELLEHEN
ncbi:hypothetical protein ACA910_010278 [Epithemia clementina (nom. ined.)]